MAIKTKEQLRNDAITFIPDNVNREISPEDVRQRIVDIADSVAFTATLPVLSNVAISGQYADLLGKPTYSVVANTGSYNDLLNKPAFANVAISGEYVDLINRPNFATVATSGSYNDLTNKPSVVAGTGLSGGGTLSANVTVSLSTASQASLTKADAALPRDGSQAMSGDLTIQRGTNGAGLLLVGDGVKQIYMSNNTYGNECLIYSNPADKKLTVRPYANNTAYKEFVFDPVSGDFTLPNNPTIPQAATQRSYVDNFAPGYRNKVINGDFNIWQRGFGPFTSNGYTADRWGMSMAGTGTASSVSRQAFPMGDESVPGNTEVYWRMSVTNGGDSTFGFVGAYHLIENVRTCANKTVTLTFYARADTAGKKIAIGNPQSFGSSGDPRVDRYVATATLTTSFQKYQYVFTVNSIVGKTRGGNNDWVGIEFYFSAGTNFAARTNNLGIQTGTFDIARVSLVEGDATGEADPFSPRHIQQELALCQRYFCIMHLGLQIPAVGNGLAYYKFPVPMRATPTMTVQSAGGSNAATLNNSIGNLNNTGAYFQITTTAASGYVDSWIGWYSAEL